ncbi:IS982 family transposase [Candidatus Tisiphia endosymbiont of Dascillus cervinus]|uniref:IS982 family transposase n=1 Tax=Candidatus Tisiphia endosymbiont of Dascillus cervinus TaxID=3066253 RepID=UPI00312C8114
MKKDFTAIYCFVDDFIKNLENNLPTINSSKFKPGVSNYLSISEVLTILIGYYDSYCDCFKHYYKQVILHNYTEDFKLVSYEHFTKLIGRSMPYLAILLNHLLAECTGLSFVDATGIAVCKNYRISSHKVFKGIAARGKTTKGWFYGLKLHLIIDSEGNLIKVSFSSGNKDDRKGLKGMIFGIYGKVFGDRGYISKELFDDLYDKGIQLITRVKKNMKNILIPIIDKVMLLKRTLIETVIGKLKFLDKLEHSRHRSVTNAFSHMLSCLINYQLLENKPSIKTLLPIELFDIQN